MFKITTFLALLAMFSCQANAQSYVYQLEVNENEIFHPKEIIEIFNQDMVCSNMTYFNNHDFLFMSNANKDEDYFRTVITSLGLNLQHFEKSRVFNEATSEKAGGPDCESAELLCSNASMSANSAGSGTTQELNGSNQGCMSVEHQSSWYYVNIGTGGSLSMVIDPANNSDDYDFAIWGPFTSANAGANCPPLSAPIRCSWSSQLDQTGMMAPYTGQTSSFGCGFLGLFPCTGLITSNNNPVDNSEGAGGDGWVNQLNVTSGQVYILLVDNFSNSGQPYALNWGGTAVLNCTPVVLPIELADFGAEQQGRYNKVDWQTLTELNNDYFVVQRSTDGIMWQDLGQVDGAGQTSEAHTYEFLDKDFEYTINYYRIKQVDFDGTEKFSWIEKVDNSLGSKTVLKTVNLMGQEVPEDFQGMRMVIYTDGTIIKKY